MTIDGTAVVIAALAAVPPTLLALATLLTSLKNGTKVQELHLAVNSRMDQLLVATKQQGRQDERDSPGGPAKPIEPASPVVAGAPPPVTK